MKNNKWDIFFLGYISTGFVFPVNRNVNRLYGVMCTHAYCIGINMIKKIADEYTPSSSGMNIITTKNKIGDHGAIDDYIRKESFHNMTYGIQPSAYYQFNDPGGVLRMKYKYHIWENIDSDEWPNYVNCTLMSVSIIICIIVSILIFVVLIMLMKVINV